MKEYFKIYHPNVKLEPIKIDLFSDEVLGRKLFYQKGKILTKTCIVNKVFIKEHDFKGFRDALFLNPDELKLDNTEAEYLVSDLLDIASEYRCFVHRGKLVGMKHYLGNVYDIPNEKYVSKVISEFNKMSKRTTYSFDVSTDIYGKNQLLEVHDFFSTGLYGFSEYNILPQMFAASYIFNAKIVS